MLLTTKIVRTTLGSRCPINAEQQWQPGQWLTGNHGPDFAGVRVIYTAICFRLLFINTVRCYTGQSCPGWVKEPSSSYREGTKTLGQRVDMVFHVGRNRHGRNPGFTQTIDLPQHGRGRRLHHFSDRSLFHRGFVSIEDLINVKCLQKGPASRKRGLNCVSLPHQIDML